MTFRTTLKIVRTREIGPVLDEGCVEPVFYGANILIDPGFENHLSVTGGGSGNEIPVDGVPGLDGPPGHGRVVWEDDTNASGSGWMADNPSTWIISTANPRSGSHHARCEELGTAGNILWPIRIELCSWPGPPYDFPWPDFGVAAAKVEPGDEINWSFYLSCNNLSGGPRFGYGVFFLDSFGDYLDEDDTLNVTPTTSYVQYTHNVVVPNDGTTFILPWIGNHDPVGPFPIPFPLWYDVDDCTLELIPA